MGRYAIEMNRTASATLAIGNFTADATRPRRAKLYEFSFGSEATPADGAFLVQFQRCTTAGTGTGVTPQAIDPGDAATEMDALENHTIDPTLTASTILASFPMNQRATIHWIFPPGGELVIPATASNGLAMRTPTASTVAVSACLYVEEQ
jgi:hypothetical protein